ncbi:unnamed protein product [Lactuca virosa]|uniref:SPX domain-containing protein n=1 Tax=Lactuca virosa TaxID=75947 RepID=A0AAU9PB75_9ASTR|nr:unnamed protein product [Lactuca virosa]
MSFPPPPSPDSINSVEFLNYNDLHSILCDYGEKIEANRSEMQRMKEELAQDFIFYRVDHISLQRKLEDHDRKFQALVLVMGGMMVAMLRIMVVLLHTVMKLG